MNETYHLWSYFINKGFKRLILDISKKKILILDIWNILVFIFKN